MNRIGGKVWSKIGAFGSTQKRFLIEQPLVPAPGHCNSDHFNMGRKKGKASQRRETSNFRSTTIRDTFQNKNPIIEY